MAPEEVRTHGFQGYSEKIKQEILERHRNGEKIADLAKEYKIHPTTIFRWIKAEKLQGKERKQALKKAMAMTDSSHLISRSKASFEDQKSSVEVGKMGRIEQLEYTIEELINYISKLERKLLDRTVGVPPSVAAILDQATKVKLKK